jgi:tetratricopeptide (TPR) repeat protein
VKKRTLSLCWALLLTAPLAAYAEVIIKRVEQSEGNDVQLTLEASQASAMTQEARSLEKQGKTKDALIRYEEVISRFSGSLAKASNWRFSIPYSVNFLYYAELLEALKQNEKALASYSQVIKLYGDSDKVGLQERVKEALSGRSDLYDLMGKTVEARAGYEEIVRRTNASPGVEDIKRLMRAKSYLSLSEADFWSGTYRMQPGSQANARPIPVSVFKISKLADLSSSAVAARYESDLARWQLTTVASDSEQVGLRRFVLNDDFDEYKQFGWTSLYLQNKMECMDGGRFFFCKTKPLSTVVFSNTESYVSKTGYFGILLHAGVFDLVKID